MKYLIDSWAWIEYLDGTKNGLKVKEILTEENEVFTLILSLAEIISRAKRKGKDIEGVENAILVNSKIINVNVEMSKQAGLLHAEMRKMIKDFGLIDAFILAVAKKLNVKIVTGDEHFKSFKNVLFVK